jgi:hypothetical protein
MRSILVVTLVAATTIASGARADEQVGSCPDASACSELFGDSVDHEENREQRESLLARVSVGRYCITVIHSTDWKVARRIHFAELELEDTEVPEEGEPVAFFELLEAPEGTGCDTTTYALQVDDSIGADARILAILEDVVLIELDERLAFILPEGSESPAWRMVWKSPWVMPRLPGVRGVSTGSSSRRNIRKPKYNRRKRKKR